MAGLLALLCAALLVDGGTPVGAGQRQALHGHMPAVVKGLKALHRLPGTNRLELSFGLPLRNREALTNLLQQLYDPASPQYRQYLTPEQFADRFAPTEQDYQAVKDFARSKGLAVTGTCVNRTLLQVNGPVADIERAFYVNLKVYQHPKEARAFYSPDAEPSLDLPVPLLSICGLDDLDLPRPMGLRKASLAEALSAAPFVTGSGPRGNFLGGDFRAAYAPGVSLDGTGQAVGLFELDDYYPSDIATYEGMAGVPHVPLTNFWLNRPPNSPGPNNVEVALDIDMAIVMAPGLSRVIVYEGPNFNNVTYPNLVLNCMATNNQAKQLSCSWGFRINGNTVQIYQQFAAQGQSMFQSSGDFGAWGGCNAIQSPCDIPLATVVGGTTLTTSGTGGSWVSEAAWSGSGGGSSISYPMPCYQKCLDMSINHGSSTMRNIPDVAAVGDVSIWLVAGHGEQFAVGGTSAGAPLWAGFAALANQQAALSGKPSIGFMNPALYAVGQSPIGASAFHDITTGNNTNSCSPDKFFAVPGYDLCTGWGTPTGSNLIQALVTPPDALQITPATAYVFSGPVGGPFSPAVQNFALVNHSCVTNNDCPPLNWTLSNSVAWLNLSSASGTLPGCGAATVAAMLTAVASNLSAGSYAVTVWFTNLNEPAGFTNASGYSAQSRQVVLDVVTPPVIISQPANQVVFEGMTATFTIGVSNPASMSYRWQVDDGTSLSNLSDGGNFSGSATSTLTLRNVGTNDVGAYSVIVSNAAGVVASASAFLGLVPWRPVITTQPVSQTVPPAATATFTVSAVGSQPFIYRWRRNATNLTDGAKFSGSASSTLTISNVSSADGGNYSVIVSNALGATPSSEAVLGVYSNTAPDILLDIQYGFSGGNGGGDPNGLVQAADGNLYGTTQNGGTNSAGTVFQMTSNGVVTTLRSLAGATDGARPRAPLALGADGNLYGTTFLGGASGAGTVFRVTPAGLLTNLYTFTGAPDGQSPFAPVMQADNGDFCGTTAQGGVNGFGALFRMTPAGLLTNLFSFTAGQEGAFPVCALLQGNDGSLYGTTYTGSSHGVGAVFKATSTGAVTPLVSFDYVNGGFAHAGLVQGSDGNFYGTTAYCGASGNGTLFRMTSKGVLTNLHSFAGDSDGAFPFGPLLQSTNGNFYGTTTAGGAWNSGTVFRMAPDGTLVTLVEFDGYDGANPEAGLIEARDGALYGTTATGGPGGQGTIFRVRINSAPLITSQPASQAAFTGVDVRMSVAVSGTPQMVYQWRKNGTKLADGGNLSGATNRILTLNSVTTADAGTYSVVISNLLGSVTSSNAMLAVTTSPPIITLQPVSQTVTPGASATFSVDAVGSLPLFFQWQKNGTNLTDGSNVSGSAADVLTLSNLLEPDSGTYAVVVSNAFGSVPSAGATLAVIPASAPGTRLTTLHGFTEGDDGASPNGLVQATNGSFYGTTSFGGAGHGGTVFNLAPDGALRTLVAFGWTNGALPTAALVQGSDGRLYGTTEYGGDHDAGTLFDMTADGGLATLHSFWGETDGANPYAALVQGTNGSFYGTTQNGWFSDEGTIFSITPEGLLTTVFSFTGDARGSSPVAALVQASDGAFYGTTPNGGTAGAGNVFKLTPDGNLSTLYSFPRDSNGPFPLGNDPVAALVQGADGAFYGTAKHSSLLGTAFYGAVFKITTNGAFTSLYGFNGSFVTDGWYPEASLIQGADGNFYGTTYGGGANLFGTVFRITPSGTASLLVSFDGFDAGAHPDSALVAGADGSFYGTTTEGGVGGHGTVFRLSFAPQITGQPTNQTVWAGANASFTVSLFGSQPLFYQWRLNGTNLLDVGNVSGATNRTLTLANVSLADAGNYSVQVSNALGSVTSSAALLTVVYPPVFLSAVSSNCILSLAWSATAGQSYRLESKPSLASTDWTPMGSSITATGSVVTVSDNLCTNAQKFYRVVLTPQVQ